MVIRLKRSPLNNYYNTPKTKSGFDSKFEARKALEIKQMYMANLIKDFYLQFPIDLICNGYKVCTYIMDFVIVHLDGTVEMLETKGLPTEVWKIKYKLLKAMYADHANVKITVEFQNPKKHREPKPKKLPKNYTPQFEAYR